jgi:4-hydroxymandelate oxidase
MKKAILTRRKALAGFASLAAAPLSADQAPKLVGEPPGRIAPRADLVNTFEFEAVAERLLAPHVYAEIAGGDRGFFDRITFRPRMMASTMNLDLTTTMFGSQMFAPILVGPVGKQQSFHPEGELAMVRGASAAKAWVVLSSDSSFPITKIAAEAKTTIWYQIYPEPDIGALRSRIAEAVQAGCKAVCITAGAPLRNAAAAPNPARLAALARTPLNWNMIDQLRRGLSVPVLVKGIMNPQEAGEAVKRGVQGIVVSNYGGLLTPGMASSMEMLSPIADAVAGKAPVLVDGSFRRGSDILKALAFGASAVLVARPPVWGLAAYGPEGVQSVLEMLQTELGRDMCACGKPNLKSIDRSIVKLHEA